MSSVWKLIAATGRFVKDFYEQKQLLQRHIYPLLKAYPVENPETGKRIIQYANLIPVISGGSFATLRGKKLTEKERLLQTFLAALTPIGDDLFDVEHKAEDELMQLVSKPFLFSSPQETHPLGVDILKKIHRLLEHPQQFIDYFEKVFSAQKASQKQLDKDLSSEEIQQITFDKGGYSALLYRSIMSHPLGEQEEKAIYQLGGLVQLMDDTFDVYEDYQQGIRTLPNQTHDISVIKSFFEAELMQLGGIFRSLDYPAKNIEKFLFEITLILSREMICLEQLLALQDRNQGSFAIEPFERKELICDMEKTGNLMKSIRYALAHQM
ncbi:hypothetical protein AAG747_20975 [Rapidithrix thailandica]|uniref:Uncharacterized protein n=1 Tax=Rapidithrix thailandica TaxID=413964 RepID=A0AAW9S5E9_9BACT